MSSTFGMLGGASHLVTLPRSKGSSPQLWRSRGGRGGFVADISHKQGPGLLEGRKATNTVCLQDQPSPPALAATVPTSPAPVAPPSQASVEAILV